MSPLKNLLRKPLERNIMGSRNTHRINATVLTNYGAYALVQNLSNQETVGMKISEEQARGLIPGNDYLMEYTPHFCELIRFEERDYDTKPH